MTYFPSRVEQLVQFVPGKYEGNQDANWNSMSIYIIKGREDVVKDFS